jgi:hypothetical protein
LGWKWIQIVGSPYAVKAYRPDPYIGNWAEIDLVREKLHERKMGYRSQKLTCHHFSGF